MTDVSPSVPLEQQTTLTSWQAPVLPRHERTKQWYIVGGVAVLIGAVYGILTGSWPFTIVILLCGAMYYLMRDHVPPLKTMTLTTGGVLLEKSFTRWEDLAGFWILETPGYTEIHFVPKAKRSSDILIQTNGQDLTQLRMLIGPYISELKDKKESLLDALVRTAKL
ncbi:hypothetical protein K8942_03880 [Candidatus Peribacteria bacterium]|nr:MAG: hypothetical protein K8942_03880 [Candidatus Peribacteria bacterium]